MGEILGLGGESVADAQLEVAGLALHATLSEQAPDAPAYYDTAVSGGLGLPEAVVHGGSQTTTQPTNGTASGGGGSHGGTTTSRR